MSNKGSGLWLPPRYEAETLDDGAVVSLIRQRVDGSHREVSDRLRLGPNAVRASIIHPDGSVTDLGVSHNLLTNAGRDLWAAALGHAPGAAGAFTAATATSGTTTGLTTDQYKGWRIYVPVTGLTTSPVYGNVGTNSTTAFTVDQWWTAADGTGTTPSATAAYLVLPQSTFRFMGLTTDAAAAAATDTTLATEITTGGAARALATYAHTAATNTYTLTKAFAITATFTAIHKMALFTNKDTTSGGIMGFETVLNQDATVGNGDTLTVTETVTLSG